MYRFIINVSIFSLAVIFYSCSSNVNRPVTKGIYYSKSVFQLNEEEQNWLKKNNIQKIYIRFFNVDYNSGLGGPVPVSNLKVKQRKVEGISIVPAVFITNRTFKNLPDSMVNNLAEKIFNRATIKCFEFDNIFIDEIQIDCDWTEDTKGKYFKFLSLLNKLGSPENIQITATVRLHHVHNYTMGDVPPVDRGSLMFYNMNPVSGMSGSKIFNPNIAKKYLNNFRHYPLKLDVILPAFSWGVLYRNSEVKGVVRNLSIEDLSKNKNFTQISENIFKAAKINTLYNRVVFKNDIIRIEEANEKTTQLAAKMLAPHIGGDSLSVSIYHLNKDVITNYEKREWENITSFFQ